MFLVHATIELDTDELTVEVPADLTAALAAHPAADRRFERLSYSRPTEYVEGLASAKRADTRSRRVAQVAMIAGEGDSGLA